MGGEEAAVEVASVGEQRTFDFDIRCSTLWCISGNLPVGAIQAPEHEKQQLHALVGTTMWLAQRAKLYTVCLC